MFDYQENFNGKDEYSLLNIRDKGKSMNVQINNMANCPTLLKGMSHEMRTYMNAIVAFSFLMKDNSCNYSEREEFSKHILSSCEQLIELFDSFLNSSIIDTDNSKTVPEICNPDNFLDGLFSEFREILSKDGSEDMELITEIRFSGSIEVSIDKDKVLKVIRTLFQNSLKNTNSGYIKIGYYYSDDKLTFYVLDSGQGYFKCKEFLHTEDLNESLCKHNDTFTAINIILARKLIQMLEGNIWIECNGITGTGIYFSVPARIVSNSRIKLNKYANIMI